MSKHDDNIIQALYQPWQQPTLEHLLSLKQQSRIPHAILIEAKSEQVGASFIWHIVMLLLCKNTQTLEPCGQCQSCELMQSNTYSDVSFITLRMDSKTKKINKNIKIEDIRNLIHEVNLTPRYDNLKVAAIYPAEKMSIAGANSLLKTLEEPTPQTLILLLTHNKSKLPVTIRSRCQILTLEHPHRDTALAWLKQQGVSPEESIQYLEYATDDPLLALELQANNYADIVKQFKAQFSLYIKNNIDVVNLTSILIALEPRLVRRLIKMVLKAYSLQMSGFSQSQGLASKINKKAGQKILNLSIEAEQQLMVEENNLNLQIQLEDVLISLKRIILQSANE